jgi:hypothetical protein
MPLSRGLFRHVKALFSNQQSSHFIPALHLRCYAKEIATCRSSGSRTNKTAPISSPAEVSEIPAKRSRKERTKPTQEAIEQVFLPAVPDEAPKKVAKRSAKRPAKEAAKPAQDAPKQVCFSLHVIVLQAGWLSFSVLYPATRSQIKASDPPKQ